MSGSGFGRRPSPRTVLALVAVVAAIAAGACNDAHRTFSIGLSPDPTATEQSTDPSIQPGVLPGEAPTVVPGPDLGESWTTEPDPETFIAMPDGTMVAPDQYLVMLSPEASRADADRVAATVDGTIGGHLEYIGVWKVLVWPNYHTAIISDRLKTLIEQPGVLAASTVGLVKVDAAPDCAPALADPVYSGANSDPYDMIGVKAAWQAFYASGLPVGTVHLGYLDTPLTHDPAGKIAWEFDDVSFVGDPGTTPDPRAPTTERPATDGFHHADGTLGILAGDGQNGGIAGVSSPLGSRLLVSHDILGGPAAAGAPSKWTAADGTTYTDDALLNTIKEIQGGATVISGSWGGYDGTGPNAGGDATMWKAFFDKMAVDHPNVLFVFSAGNDNQALNATTHYPGGIPASNVITVGSVNTDGTRTSYSNGVLPGSTGEVTLGAPGHQAVWGIGADGKLRATNGGTSSAAPMVSATAALIRSIDPSLDAAAIKQIIADTASAGNRDLGGKTLRVDLALRKVIDDVRDKKYGLPPLTDGQIYAATAYCQIDISAELQGRLTQPAGASRWSVKASIDDSVRAGRMVELSLLEDGARPTNWTQAVTAGGAPAGWTILVSKNGAAIIVTRHDNGYWLKRTIRDTVPATPSPTEIPIASPTATPASSGYDCSNPPPRGTIEYAKWSLHCKPIAP
jgi:hypothetical protein